MEFIKNLKNFSIICALALFTALATSACGSNTGDLADIQTAEEGAQVVEENDPVVEPGNDDGGGGGGGGGGVRPDIFDNIVDAEIVVDDGGSEPPSGGGGGGVPPQEDKCDVESPVGTKNLVNVETQTGGQPGTVDPGNCIII